MAGHTTGETRKLQQVGGGTYTVSIPKDWATDHGLEAGQSVHLYPDAEGALIVRPEGNAGPRDVRIPVTETGEAALERTLLAAYAAGVERLTLVATESYTQTDRRCIEGLVRDHAGMRVVESGDDELTVATTLDAGEVSVERSVVQLQFVALSLFRTAIEGTLGGGDVDEDHLAERRTDARRLTTLVTRQFGRALTAPTTVAELAAHRPALFDYYRCARALDRVARLSEAIATVEVDGPATVGADGSEHVADPESLERTADAIRLFLEDATTAVVDGADTDTLQALHATGADLMADLGGPAPAYPCDAPADRLVGLLGAATREGIVVASVAYEAVLRRRSSPTTD